MQRLASLFFIGGSVFLMSFTTPATVNKGEKPTKTAAARKAVVFQVDSKESKLNWTGKKVTGQHQGTINIADGKLDVENNVLKGGSFQRQVYRLHCG